MTCREFKHIAASFSLKEFVQRQDARLMGHVLSCPACEAWMEKQRSLNASLHTLRVRTSSLEAGADVEGALLRVFRQGIPAGGASAATAQLAVVGGRALAGMKEPKSQAAPRSTPWALRLSRFFEVGAYAAVAAAIIVALLLGMLLLQGHKPTPTESKSAPMSVAPVPESGAASPTASTAIARVVPKVPEAAKHRATVPEGVEQKSPAALSRDAASPDDAQPDSEGYVALMFCDPLSCSSETQVVRMELPDATGAQPQAADVVVGYDGAVRAVRFVN